MTLTPARARLRVERELGVYDRVVAAEVAEVRARLYRRARERQVVEVSDATDRGVVAAHQPDRALEVFDVDVRRADAPGLQSLRDRARAPLVNVRDRHGLHALGVVREVVGRAEPHPPRAEHEDSHPRPSRLARSVNRCPRPCPASATCRRTNRRARRRARPRLVSTRRERARGGRPPRQTRCAATPWGRGRGGWRRARRPARRNRAPRA